VTARANRGEFSFESERVKELFLRVVKRAKAKLSFVLRNFCIMGNHIHLMLRPIGGASLSRIMQWVLSVFAAAFNRMFGIQGHVWYDRFKSKVIESVQQQLATFRYIARNPVVAKIVAAPVEYAYGGVRHIRDGDWSLIDRSGAAPAIVEAGLMLPILLPA
jgi:putative transposase